MTVVYPVSRLLSNPRIFLAISNHLGGVLDAEVLRDVFYELLEVEINGSPDEDCEFSAEEACFEVEEDGLVYHIYFDTGASFKLEVTEEGFHPQISTEFELATASAEQQAHLSNRRLSPGAQRRYFVRAPPNTRQQLPKLKRRGRILW